MIRAENLWKKFGRHEALRGLSFSVPEGSAYALIGSNGAGKTTTIRVLMNILEAERGHATVLGVNSRRLSPRELAQIGYVSENQQFPGRLTVGQYLDYLRPFYTSWDKSLEAAIGTRLRLPVARRIGHLSHGMRMKFALLCALPFRPKVLILDEPFSGLDPLVRDEFLESMLQLAGEMTVFVSSHELHEIDGVATHVAFLEEGRLHFQESMADLTARFREVHVTLDRAARPPANAPREWLNVNTLGNVLTFVNSGFSDDRLRDGLSALNGSVRRVDTKPMPLRSIFVALALSAREKQDQRQERMNP